MSGGQIIVQLGLVFNKLSLLSVLIYTYWNICHTELVEASKMS